MVQNPYGSHLHSRTYPMLYNMTHLVNPTWNIGGKEMENQQTQVKMTLIFKWMLQEQHAMSEVVAAVERLMQRHEQFDGKDVSLYLRDYKA